MSTRSQLLAQKAFARVAAHGHLNKEYVSFAKKFPALIHTCGLAQALAFALAKGGQQAEYIEDLANVVNYSDDNNNTSAEILDHQAREHRLSEYLRLSRDAIDAAGWLKRYVEAAAPDARQEVD